MKALWLLSGLIASTAAFASEKNICDAIGRDYEKCVRTSVCFWDEDDQRCEWLNDPCEKYGNNSYACSRDRSCFWDSDDQRCEKIY